MIYLDYAAATPLSEKAKRAMLPYFDEKFFNPSAAYLPATETRRDYEQAKADIAHVIGAKAADIVMTSGATEANSLVFASIPNDAEVLISAVEHPSILENAKQKKYQTIAVDESGRVNLDDLRAKITPQTQLISICLASSELGTIQPLSDVARIVLEERTRRAFAGEKTPIYFHSDASQGLGLMEVKVSRLGVDLITINAAKVYGPKGIGALYVGHNVRLNPQTHGGGQELGLRSGTENVPATMAFAAAILEAEKHLFGERKRLSLLRNKFKKLLSEKIEGLEFLGKEKTQLVNFMPISIPGLDAERLIFALEEHEVYLSTGAACAASKGEKSPTLRAIGLSDEQIAGSLRITLGRPTTDEDVERAADAIAQVVAKERARISK
ncbi:MAG: cysteine desulfurase [Candidatus Saccharibacteria bacterium]|nr:cysteine desulfurase [Candidatus Saccharibacteria bacterium]